MLKKKARFIVQCFHRDNLLVIGEFFRIDTADGFQVDVSPLLNSSVS